MSEFIAHINVNSESGIEQIQTVKEHCRQTATYAAEDLMEVGLEKTAAFSGFIHDMGKMSHCFQRYIRLDDSQKVRGSINHTFAGVRLVLERYHQEGRFDYQDIAAEMIAFAVGSHHGQFDCNDPDRKNGFDHRLTKEGTCAEEAIDKFLHNCVSETELDELFQQAVQEVTALYDAICVQTQDGEEVLFYLGLAARLLLSAVIDGDRRDTAEFMAHIVFPQLPKRMQSIWWEALERVETKIATFPCERPIDLARREISNQCRAFAANPGGIYRLNVPTGGGKTLSSLRYALAHAAQKNKKRILYVLPLLAIIEQNANVIREFVQDDRLILEHHSNVVQTKTDKEELDQRELLHSNWNATIVITTLVQFLNTLFDGKTSSIRRFQALCESVIVLDEVQTVPLKMLSQFNLAINFLSKFCGATVVLCSATQPCLEEAVHPLLDAQQQIVPYDEKLWAAFRRTKLVMLPVMNLDGIAQCARKTLDEADSLLIVCNTKAEAVKLYALLEGAAEYRFLFSAAMCAAHRKKVIKEMSGILQNEAGKEEKKKLVCVSTQAIEAGVDISFESVIRLLAGMDNVIQTAGRCNRNSEYGGLATVSIVRCREEQLRNLPEIQLAQDAMMQLSAAFNINPVRFDEDLSSDRSVHYFYQELFRSFQNGQDYILSELNTNMVSLLSANIQFTGKKASSHYFLRQAFKTAGAYFSVFDDELSKEVLVPYGEKGKELIAELGSQRAASDFLYMKKLIEQSRLYSISVFSNQIATLEQNGGVFQIGESGVLALQKEYYDEKTGFFPGGKEQEFLEVKNDAASEYCGI